MEERLNRLSGGFVSLNHEGNILEANQTFLLWMGLTEEQVAHLHIEELLTAASKMMFHSYFYPNINLYGQIDELFLHFRDMQGSSSAYLMNAKKYVGPNGEVIDCLVIPMKKRMEYEIELRGAKRQLEQAYQEKKEALKKVQALNEEIEQQQQKLVQMNRELLVLSNTDKLTGIANRRLFQQHLDELNRVFQHEKKSFSVLLIDIDFFKKVNDTFGHAVGDLVLQKLAEILAASARPEDHVARYGGEEFVVLLPNTDIDTALHIAQQLNQTVRQSDWPEIGGGLTISVGAATYNADSTVDSIIEYADQALYSSKRNGRNRASHYHYIEK